MVIPMMAMPEREDVHQEVSMEEAPHNVHHAVHQQQVQEYVMDRYEEWKQLYELLQMLPPQWPETPCPICQVTQGSTQQQVMTPMAQCSLMYRQCLRCLSEYGQCGGNIPMHCLAQESDQGQGMVL